jgi:hypothetical protein
MNDPPSQRNVLPRMRQTEAMLLVMVGLFRGGCTALWWAQCNASLEGAGVLAGVVGGSSRVGGGLGWTRYGSIGWHYGIGAIVGTDETVGGVVVA